MKDIFKQELPGLEITSIKLRINIDLFFEKLRPLFKNQNTGGASAQAINREDVFQRINSNIGYANIMLEALVNEVQIPKQKQRR